MLTYIALITSVFYSILCTGIQSIMLLNGLLFAYIEKVTYIATMFINRTLTKAELCELLGFITPSGKPDYVKLRGEIDEELLDKMNINHKKYSRLQKFSTVQTIILIEHFRLWVLKEVEEAGIWRYVAPSVKSKMYNECN